MAEAKQGDTVRVHYTGQLDDGTEFDSSRDRDPLEFQVGSGQVIAGFESAVAGMAVGDSCTTTIVAAEAYGPRRDELVVDIERSQLPADMDLEVGQALQVKDQNDQPFVVHVAAVAEESVKLDANHPLAGKDLTFEIELVEIV
ncbi:MAG: FKBP-type peptidyl-prolyl cis-trans isomerase [Gammaproteobacteria bacterium]|nr:FKBP-type peptidyl-prolyl cis-trans isomerase [Gammaproteobacteria bacterium]